MRSTVTYMIANDWRGLTLLSPEQILLELERVEAIVARVAALTCSGVSRALAYAIVMEPAAGAYIQQVFDASAEQRQQAEQVSKAQLEDFEQGVRGRLERIETVATQRVRQLEADQVAEVRLANSERDGAVSHLHRMEADMRSAIGQSEQAEIARLQAARAQDAQMVEARVMEEANFEYELKEQRWRQELVQSERAAHAGGLADAIVPQPSLPDFWLKLPGPGSAATAIAWPGAG